MRQKRNVIIGLDGMPYSLIRDLSENGTLPNVNALISDGSFRPMTSSIPEISSVAWSSIITGKNPGEHGIFGFSDLMPGTYGVVYPNFNSLKATPFWETSDKNKAVIINVPSTYPARRLNGILISGFVALDLKKATYPTSLVPELERLDYRLDVDSEKAHQSIEFFLRDLASTLQARIAAYRYLWSKEDWRTFMLVFTGTDRLAHFLWEAYEDKAHKYHRVFLEHLRQIDGVIGEIANKIDDGDLLILLSDHGFERLERNVYINFILQQEGFLKFERGSSNLKHIHSDTQAFALDPARIYVNMQGKYPRGSIVPSVREAVLEALTTLFEDLAIEGKRVIRHIYRKEEVYKGPFMAQAPDLVLEGDKGFNLRATTNAKTLSGGDLFTGKHSQPDAFLLVKGALDECSLPDEPDVTDVVPLLTRMGRGGQCGNRRP